MKCPKCQAEFSKEAAIQNTGECPTCGEYLPFLMRLKLVWHHFATTWTEDMAAAREAAKPPTVVCLCGSTRFRAAYQAAFYDEEHAGRIVLSVPCYKDDPCCKSKADWDKLDALHRHKIDLADEILVLNVGGYIGESTRKEIDYATQTWKRVRYLEIPGAHPPPFMPADVNLDDEFLSTFGCREFEVAAAEIVRFLADPRRKLSDRELGYWEDGQGWEKRFRHDTIPGVGPSMFAMLCASGWIVNVWFPKGAFIVSEAFVERASRKRQPRELVH